MRHLLRTCVLGALIVFAIGCGPGAPDEKEVLISLTDSLIVPGYEAASDAAHELRNALDNLCSGPSDSALNDAQQAWRDARAPWMRSEATWFGPVMDRRSVRLVDWPQTEPERIEAMLAGDAATTEDDVRNRLASTQRGLGAIEHVLFSENSPESLQDPSSVRCGYLTALGRVVESESSAIFAEWKIERNGLSAYESFFTGRSESSLATDQAVAELVRTQVFQIRTIVDMRLAGALGLRDAEPDPSALPGGEGHNSLSDLRNEILGMRDMYVGHEESGGSGISDIVLGLSSETDERMREHFASSLTAIDAVEPPLRMAVKERPEQVQAVYDRLSELQRTLSTEVVSLLGVSVGFSDTDGDSLR